MWLNIPNDNNSVYGGVHSDDDDDDDNNNNNISIKFSRADSRVRM